MITRHSVVIAISAFLALSHCSILRAQSPTSLNARTLELSISSGTFPFASTGGFRFLSSPTDNRYAIVPLSPNVAASSGTYSYSKTGSQTATMTANDDGVGPVTITCQFTTETSGTFRITSVLAPGASQSGTFRMFSGPAPTSLAGKIFTVTVTSGEFPFAQTGSYQFIPDASGNGYRVNGISGVANSSGTYSYTQSSATTGVMTFTDSVVGAGFSQQLSFDTASSGSGYIKRAGTSGYQTTIFSFTSSVVPPQISVPPATQSVSLGATLTLSVVAAGTSPLAYQWFKNGVAIANATISSFTIGNVQEADAGSYSVRVSNSGGAVTSSAAVISVVVPPQILSQPAGAIARAGTNLILQVSAAGSAPLSYQWQLNGNNIPGAVGQFYSISNVQPSQSGRYTVHVSNAAGAVTSATADVVIWTVAAKQPSLKELTRAGAVNLLALDGLEIHSRYRVQASANMFRWNEVTNFVAGKTTLHVSDSETTSSRRFFRLVSP